mgnify:CR=1 FL=1
MKPQWIFCLIIVLLAACESVEPAPTATPTRALTGPTVEASPIVRGELPTQQPTLQFIGQNDPTAAAMPSGGNLPPLPVGTPVQGEVRQAIQITVADGRTLPGDLYSLGDQRVPGLLMLAPDSDAWLDLPLRLQAAGFTVLTIDLAAVASPDDVSGLLQSLSDFGSVDPGRMGVIGGEGGADVALAGCATELLCDAVALVSPTQHDPLLIAMQRFNPRALFAAAGQDDAASYAAAQALVDYGQGESALETGTGAARGALLVQQNPAIGDALIDWLEVQFAA